MNIKGILSEVTDENEKYSLRYGREGNFLII
jgi:hypothetical protein